MGWKRSSDVSYEELKVQLRYLIKKYNRICQFCFTEIPKGRATREHIERLADGGTSDLDNLTLSCFQCNLNRNDDAIRVEFISLHIKETIERQALGLPVVGKAPLNTTTVADTWPILITKGIKGTIRRQQISVHLVTRPPGSVQYGTFTGRRKIYNC